MLLFEGIRLALRSIVAQKLRTFLTLLANIVAVASVIAIVSILDGMDRYVKEQVAGEGTGIVTLRRVDPLKILSNLDEFLESLRNPRITVDDVEYLRDNLTRAEEVDAHLSSSGRVSFRERFIDNIQIVGRGSNYPVFRDTALTAGRHFGALDVRAKSAVAVIGADVASNLFPNQDPLDKALKIGRRPFRIIGILDKEPTGLGSDPNRQLFIPVTTYQKIYGTRSSVSALIKVRDIEEIGEAVSEVTTLMRMRHRLRPKERSDFEVTTAEGLVSLWEAISRSIFLSLTGISAISLLIGGIIIMNIMLVSVTERIREIGLRGDRPGIPGRLPGGGVLPAPLLHRAVGHRGRVGGDGGHGGLLRHLPGEQGGTARSDRGTAS